MQAQRWRGKKAGALAQAAAPVHLQAITSSARVAPQQSPILSMDACHDDAWRQPKQERRPDPRLEGIHGGSPLELGPKRSQRSSTNQPTGTWEAGAWLHRPFLLARKRPSRRKVSLRWHVDSAHAERMSDLFGLAPARWSQRILGVRSARTCPTAVRRAYPRRDVSGCSREEKNGCQMMPRKRRP